MKSSKEYDWDKAKAMGEDFEENPPAEYEGDLDTDIVRESQGSILASKAAQRAGSILTNLDKQDLDALYSALAPLTKKLRWYMSRYGNMQDKIWYLSDENKKLLVKIQKMRRKLEEQGISVD